MTRTMPDTPSQPAAGMRPLPEAAVPRVSVIIPTLCEGKREAAILSAIRSVQGQPGVAADIVLVVNGDRFDAALYAALSERDDLKVVYMRDGDLPKARLAGRSHVTGEYFACLDDDDEFLPGALAPALRALAEDDSVDVVVCNGLRAGAEGQGDIPLFPGMASFQADPLKSLFARNWLSSSSGVFRSRSVGPEYFADMPGYFEWTHIAFRLAMEKRILFREGFLNRIHDTEDSLSKSPEYRQAILPFLRHIGTFPLRPDLRRDLQWNVCKANHHLGESHLVAGELGPAWHYHWKALRGRYGYRYLFFTRKFLAPLLAKAFGKKASLPG